MASNSIEKVGATEQIWAAIRRSVTAEQDDLIQEWRVRVVASTECITLARMTASGLAVAGVVSAEREECNLCLSAAMANGMIKTRLAVFEEVMHTLSVSTVCTSRFNAANANQMS